MSGTTTPYYHGWTTKKNGAIVVVMQRLHMNDLTGKLLQSPETWKVLSFSGGRRGRRANTDR